MQTPAVLSHNIKIGGPGVFPSIRNLQDPGVLLKDPGVLLKDPGPKRHSELDAFVGAVRPDPAGGPSKGPRGPLKGTRGPKKKGVL